MSFAFQLLQKTQRSKQYTVVKSPPDVRDYKMTVSPTASIPATVDLSPVCPPVLNQGNIGSCTANAAACMHYSVQHGTKFIPSRLYIYYNSRVLDGGDVWYDDGTTMRQTMAAIAKQGVCRETLWPYLGSNFFKRPLPACYTEGKNRRISSYASLPLQLTQMKGALAAGFPFSLSILVYSSFDSNRVAMTGDVPLPNTGIEKLLGGHAVCVIGYDDSRNAFLVRNSWGTNWGIGGNFWLPFSYATNSNLTLEAWVLYSDSLLSSSVKVVRPQ
jgi:C1A family cysteine protease